MANPTQATHETLMEYLVSRRLSGCTDIFIQIPFADKYGNVPISLDRLIDLVAEQMYTRSSTSTLPDIL